MGLFSKFDKKKKHEGRNDRKYNRNKYNPKNLATEGNEVLSSGAVVARIIKICPKTSTRR